MRHLIILFIGFHCFNPLVYAQIDTIPNTDIDLGGEDVQTSSLAPNASQVANRDLWWESFSVLDVLRMGPPNEYTGDEEIREMDYSPYLFLSLQDYLTDLSRLSFYLQSKVYELPIKEPQAEEEPHPFFEPINLEDAGYPVVRKLVYSRERHHENPFFIALDSVRKTVDTLTEHSDRYLFLKKLYKMTFRGDQYWGRLIYNRKPLDYYYQRPLARWQDETYEWRINLLEFYAQAVDQQWALYLDQHPDQSAEFSDINTFEKIKLLVPLLEKSPIDSTHLAYLIQIENRLERFKTNLSEEQQALENLFSQHPEWLTKEEDSLFLALINIPNHLIQSLEQGRSQIEAIIHRTTEQSTYMDLIIASNVLEERYQDHFSFIDRNQALWINTTRKNLRKTYHDQVNAEDENFNLLQKQYWEDQANR